MTNKDLIAQLAERTDQTKVRTTELLNTTVSMFKDALLQGYTLHIKDFGDFLIKQRGERVSVHPKTGERTIIPEKKVLIFRQTTALKQTLNPA